MINKPPGLPFLVVFSAAAAALLAGASHPSWSKLDAFLYGLPAGFLLLTYWAMRMAWADHKGTVPDGVFTRSLMPCYISAVVLLALATGAPSWVRFTISEPGMEAYVKAVNENPGHEQPCQWAGLYHACDGTRHENDSTGEGGVEFAVRDPFLPDGRGFLWLPSGEPGEYTDGDGHYTHLTGHWYSYRYDPSW
ncbi:hypothetical protein [Nonomuraea bangladeshensis]|uniref:hypothetical protein n=1 Tax=Nonomuraea bangladeshensis TaxID=404385 RepID=UPI0031D75356